MSKIMPGADDPVARHGAERMSSMKVFFVISVILETLGLDVGFSRLLTTFLLQ
jgi:hypothetical protein